MVENNRKPIASLNMFPQFTTMNVIDGQAGVIIYSSLICHSLTIDNILNIIVLLILAGVTIATLTGDNRILTKTGDARNTNIDAEIEEEIRLAWNKVYMDSYLDSTTDKANALKTELEKNGHTVEDVSSNGNKITIKNYRGKDKVLDVSTGTLTPKEPSAVAKAKSAGTVFSDDNTPLTDEDGNTVVIPKGFKISSDSAEVVTEGIVIEDATYENTIGSEFVWIPVSKDSSDANKVKGAKGNKTILLSRYTFDELGTPTNQGDNAIGIIQELSTNSYRNAVAKNINDFLIKTNNFGGFWIGRYEARKSNLGYLTEKNTDSMYNSITQKDASKKSIEMYNENIFFQSDLINSYAWDTAILFLQYFDDRMENNNKPYSIQNSLNNSESPATLGTTTDIICNIYDMASNCQEWTTETTANSKYPGVVRGGLFNESNYYASFRQGWHDISYKDVRKSFRPIIYILGI